MTQNSVPTKAGLYWAKWRNSADLHEPYRLILEIVGEAPFFRVRMWYDELWRFDVDKVGYIPSEKIGDIVWGPEIVEPEINEKGE